MNSNPTAFANPLKGGHTIAVVADRTGLSRDVLRVWERRYRAVEPDRTAGGQRLYSDEQLARFELLAQATRQGRSIGSVAGLSTSDLQSMLSADELARNTQAIEPTLPSSAPQRSTIEQTVDRALRHTTALDSASLDAELRRSLARSGLPVLLEQVIPSFMHRIGDEWSAGRLGIQHEHLASAVVLGILLEAIRGFPERVESPRLLVATPSGEQHVIGAALIAAAAAVDGWRILFLGADLPSADIAAAAEGLRAVALSLVLAADDERSIQELRAIRGALPAAVPLIVGGASALRLRDSITMPGVIVCRDIQEARTVFETLH